jgi:hypothetical protein
MDDTNFEIESHGVKMKVERLSLPGHVAFRVVFSSARQPLVVARATNADAAKFWTSVPEGRQKEAEGVGALIQEYLQSKK